jgi:16S rRNA (cytosine1402-N4)-methyltransferase
MTLPPAEEHLEPHDAGHLPVLAGEVVELLDPKPGQVFLDGTVGRGGHAAVMIPKLGPGGRYVGLDVDPQNAAYSREYLTPIAQQAGVDLDILQANFRDARGVLASLDIPSVDGLLADLGFASNQMDDPKRGFAFREDGPLDMRLDPGCPITAERLVNTLPQDELADLIYEFGEERLSRRIARKIVESRGQEPITTTSGLAELVRRAYPRPPKGRRHRIDPATRTFMALRIAVNDELGALDGLLGDLPRLLRPGGRAAVISFHSLEDRRVKRAFLALGQDVENKGAGYRVLTRKPVTASDDEAQSNPRSRSAKLRAIERPT